MYIHTGTERERHRKRGHVSLITKITGAHNILVSCRYLHVSFFTDLFCVSASFNKINK